MLEKNFIVSKNGLFLNTGSSGNSETVLEFLEDGFSKALGVEKAMYEAAVIYGYTGKTPSEFLYETSLSGSVEEFVDKMSSEKWEDSHSNPYRHELIEDTSNKERYAFDL